ncbi:protein-L-isoaspartate(D-aspartate) O-methyltransferase [Aequorivita viscosa]|uniref:Protein-L-isoaspartate O-methyltransferase n=2 Tax=Aequorivita viscosa TaxID=797419 RepID=A0A1M6IUL9_9FLAO|nr:protein-L-isoaspartate(D-aspartate) O-methyltransferase [Aequorivita viscosa]SHJ38104.1 protein-L-isoaspartate(D-aspartate) O-methyltransferase [Aequorivita viscosa]
MTFPPKLGYFVNQISQNMKDTFTHKGMRKKLVGVLEKKGILDKNVLAAIGRIPRHLFMDSGFVGHAYVDKAFPIAADQTISQPYTVARQTELLEVKKGDKILEIGTGSGYQAAVLLEMGVRLYTIERQNELFKKTKLFLPKLGYKPKRLIFGDGYIGLADEAPFDGIIVTAGAPYVPQPLLAQLKIGAKLVIPVGENVQIMTVFTRKSEKEFEKEEFGEFRFVPLLEDKN